MLTLTVQAMEDGLIDADLGGGLVKQRVARPGQGKRGGFRTVIVWRRGDIAIFLFGFAKNDRANVDDDELDELRTIARAFLGLQASEIEALRDQGAITEVIDDENP